MSPFPQTFEQLDIYVPGFEIVNKKLHHILSFFFSHKFISSWVVYHLVWNSLCIIEFANCIHPIKARELRPETRLVDTIHAFSRHHCRCHNVVQVDLAQIVLKFLPTNQTELLKKIITKDAISPLWASNCKVSALFRVQLSRGGGCFWDFMSNTTPILVQLCAWLSAWWALPPHLTVLRFLALLGSCQILESSFSI